MVFALVPSIFILHFGAIIMSLSPSINITVQPQVIIVGFESTTYTIHESQERVELSVSVKVPLTGGTPRPFSLSVSTKDNTAGTPLLQNLTVSESTLL